MSRPPKLFDPNPGTLDVRKFRDQLRDGKYAYDHASDYLIGSLVLAQRRGILAKWEGTIMRVPFRFNMVMRKTRRQLGHPFLGPDGKVMSVDGQFLRGSQLEFERSDLTFDNVEEHPGYRKWANDILYGKNRDKTSVPRKYIKKFQHQHTGDVESYLRWLGDRYWPGPGTVPLPDVNEEPAVNVKKRKSDDETPADVPQKKQNTQLDAEALTTLDVGGRQDNGERVGNWQRSIINEQDPNVGDGPSTPVWEDEPVEEADTKKEDEEDEETSVGSSTEDEFEGEVSNSDDDRNEESMDEDTQFAMIAGCMALAAGKMILRRQRRRRAIQIAAVVRRRT